MAKTVTLDLSQLLGFRIEGSTTTGAKLGLKTGAKLGQKIGVKTSR